MPVSKTHLSVVSCKRRFMLFLMLKCVTDFFSQIRRLNMSLFSGLPALSVVNNQVYLNTDVLAARQQPVIMQPGAPMYAQVPGGQPMYAQPGQPMYVQPGQPYTNNMPGMMPSNQAQVYPAPQYVPLAQVVSVDPPAYGQQVQYQPMNINKG